MIIRPGQLRFTYDSNLNVASQFSVRLENDVWKPEVSRLSENGHWPNEFSIYSQFAIYICPV